MSVSIDVNPIVAIVGIVVVAGWRSNDVIRLVRELVRRG